MEKRLFNKSELAEYLGISEGTVYVWVCYRKIPYIKVGRLVKFDRVKIDKWLDERSVKNFKFDRN